MQDPDMETLVLLYLVSIDDTNGYDAATPGIAEAVDLGEGTLADRVELLSALSTLVSKGYIEEHSQSVDELGNERNIYSLTPAGRERANEHVEDAASSSVEIVTGDGVDTLSLPQVGEYIDDDQPIVTALAQANNGRIVLDDAQPIAGGEFIDRSDALSQLHEYVADAADGHPRATMIVGEPGVGKTALLDELETHVLERGGTIARGQCRRDIDQPYQAVFELLEDLPNPTGDRLQALLSGESEQDVDDEASLSAQRSELFGLVSDRLSSLAVDAPVVFVFDDLQWVDPTTATLLAGVANQIEAAPVLLVCTCRATAWSDDSLPEQLAGPLTDPDTVIALDRFGQEATAALLKDQLGTTSVPDEFIERVYSHTGGNPLFITESMTKLRESGVVDPALETYPDSSDELPVPDAVEETIDSRFETLDDRTQELLYTGCLIGNTMPRAVLSAATTLDEPSFLDCAGILLGSDVWEIDDEGTTFRFESAVVRDRLWDHLGDERMRELHRRIANAYRRVQDDVDVSPAAIARHYEAAGAEKTALASYLDAASEAETIYAQETAIRIYGRALAVARSIGDDDAILTILEQTGDAHAVLGEYDTARWHFDAVIDRTNNVPRHQRMCRKIAETYEKQGQYDQVLDYVERGLTHTPKPPTRDERPALLSTKASALGQTGDRTAALEAANQAAAVADDIGDKRERARALRVAGTTHRQHGEIDEARSVLERAAELLQSTENYRERAAVLKELGTTNLRGNRYDRALSAYDDCYALYEEIGDRHGQCAIHNNRGVIYHYREELTAARNEYEQGIEIAERIGDEQGIAKFHTNLGYIETTLGNFEKALSWADQAERRCTAIGDRNGLISVEEIRAEVAFYRGTIGQSMTATDRALSIAEEIGDKNRKTGTLYVLGRAQLADGDVAAATETFETAVALADEHGIDQKATLNKFGLVEAQLAAGRVDAAAATLERTDGANSVSHESVPPRVAYMIRTGAYDRAEALIDRTLDHAEKTGQTPLRCRLEYEQAKLAVERGDSDAKTRIETATETASRADHNLFVEWCSELTEQS